MADFIDPTAAPPPVTLPSLPPWRRMAAALHRRRFRYFLAGSFLSNVGSWMQSVAQAWLVLELTNSAFFLGLDGFANTIPISIFAFWGGVLADRVNRRRTLLASQWVMMSLALTLAVLTQFGWVRVWQIILLSFLTGLTQGISWPVYQAIMADIADRRHLSNAIALNSAQFNLARTIGPVAGAFALHHLGAAGCFYANALSFLAVIAVLSRIDIPAHSHTAPRDESVLQALREGVRFIASHHGLMWLLISMAVTSVLGVPVVTMLPVFARDVLQIGASGLGHLVAVFGLGAVAAGIWIAYLGEFRGKGRFVMRSFGLLVISILGFSLSRHLALSFFCLATMGFSMVGFASVVNSLVQTTAPPELRGRAMSLFVFAFGGCMPLGNLLAGTLSKAFGAPHALFGMGLALGAFILYVRFAHPQTLHLK